MSNKSLGKWMCPICGRSFSRKNQPHSCELFSIKDHHFKKGTPLTIQLYNRFIKIFHKFEPITIEPLKNIIAIKKNSQFCTIQIQKQALKIRFRLYVSLSSPRLALIIHQDNMYYYQLKIQNLKEINEELIDWLNQAYVDN